MSTDNDDVIVITGASAGIGEAVARALIAPGRRLVLVARRRERLETLATELGHGTQVVAADLATDAGVRAVLAAAPTCSVLVNNAGFGRMGAFDATDRQADMVRLNCEAPVALGRHYVHGMVAARRGAIVNIGSAMGWQAMPRMAVYAASKAFVMAWTEGLAEELRGTGVSAHCICPGATPTEFGDVAGADPLVLKATYAVGTSVDQVVRATEAASRGRAGAVVVPGLLNKLVVLFSALSPRWLSRLTTGLVMRGRIRADRAVG